MSKVVVTLLSVLLILVTLLFLTWTVLSFTYYQVPSSAKEPTATAVAPSAANTAEPQNAHIGQLPPIPSNIHDDDPSRPTNMPKDVPDLPRRETVTPVKLPPSSAETSGESLNNLWFSEDENRLSSNMRPDLRPGAEGRRAHYDSGHFRDRGAPIWDPHPQYRFGAFGQVFHLSLSPADDFVSPVLRVTTHERNFTWREDPLTGTLGNKCFYRGIVNGDSDSSVAVSLCHGMTGHIRTQNGSFFIEPIGAWKGPHAPLTHAFYQTGPLPFVNVHDPMSRDHHDDEVPFTGQQELVLHNVLPETKSGNGESSGGGRRRKRSMSRERYVELMVVTDSTMAAYHGENLKHYVLTLLSIVALVYKDASIGNPVNIALVKFHVLRDKDFTWKNRATETRTDGSAFGISASEMLRNFCKWQKEHNNMDDTSPDHHDTALLLTRETICRNPWLYKCDTLGLAELGTMCDLYASCAIVQDNGLSAAFTIAHELGHVLNMPHDDDTKCHSFKNGLLPNVQAHYVMSRMLDHNTYPWAWSKCSRHYLTEFLDAGHGYCLEDTPRDNLLEAETALASGRNRPQPGEIFSEDRQCELVFGSQSQLCSYMPVCRRLWCTTGESGEEEGCRTQHMPWADGTPCARDKWCQRGACVLRDFEKLRKVDGNWGQWQPFGECSRSCGGGVRRSIRECDHPSPANGGKYCVGHRVRYESCNTHECSNDHRDFRADQCGEFNQDNFNIQGLPKNVEWVPKYAGISAKDRCKLFCRVHGSSAYYLLKEKVIDGTPCGPDTFDICVNGECRLAGCDRKLSSTRALDICGVCGGDNGSCQMQSGSYNESKYGYNPIVRIPAGASSVDIRQAGFNGSARDDNYLAILDPGSKEQYVLNGHFIVSMFRKTVHAAGTVLEYSGSDSVVERINSSRPLKSDLIIQVLSVGQLHPPDIRYQYVISLNRSQTYQWSDSDRWSPCSIPCHGTRFREPICLRNRMQEVEPRLCPGSPPPRTSSPCNENCDLRWKVIDSSPCSVSCGTGRKDLVIRCVRQFSSNYSVVSDSFCDQSTKPADVEACTETCNRPKWKYSVWSDCSSRCGEGTQSRQSTCVDSFDNVVDSGHCERLGDPQTTKKCSKNAPCGKWRVEQWSPCSVSCGKGITKALYACYQTHPGGAILPHDFCHNDPVPVVERACEGPPCVQWDVEDWSSCSRTCGLGLMTRRVFCVGDKEREVVDETFCVLNNLLKPESEKPCQIGDCPVTTTPTSTTTTSATMVTDISMNSILSSGKYSKYGHVSFGHPKYRIGEIDNSIDALAYDIDLPQSSPLIAESTQRFKWKPEPWTECFTDHFGKKIRRRRVSCVSGNQRVDEVQCSRTKPIVTQECSNQTNWHTGSWSKCNSTICDEGFENRVVECRSLADRSRLPDSECRGDAPIRLKPCTGKCIVLGSVSNSRSRSNRGFGSSSIWRTGSWSKCSQLCGGGFKLRQVICQFENGSRSSDCEIRVRPSNNSTCGTEPCPIWHTGSWSECTAECGGGLQDRRVQCRDSTGHNFPDHVCSNALKPTSTQYCNEEACTNENEMKVSVRNRWVTGTWTNCSKNCGKGVKKRSVECVKIIFDLQQRRESIVNETHCSKIPKPKAERACAKFPCPHQWVTTKWSECSIPCGYGIQQRQVTCHRVNKFGWVDPDALSSGCEGIDKPKEYSYCYHSDCNSTYKWHTEPWSPCPTNRCGKQVRQKRRVYCARKTDGLRVGGNFCPKNHKPNRKRRCDIKSCLPTTCAEYKATNLRATVDGNFTLFVGGRNMTIYCSDMGTSEPQEYITLPENNFSEIYSKRLVRPETCPQNGQRHESCDCIEDSNRRSGYTIFHKVRLNVTNLKVDTEDFRYSTQVSGSPIGFGDSGDCYSSVSCPQGRFSINLQGTNLSVSPATTWISQGHKAAMWINKSEDSVRVTGKCGGYCGTCSPNRFIGLKLQVAVT